MTQTINYNEVEGFESFQEELPKIPYISIINGSRATTEKMMPGTVFNISTKEIYGSSDEPFIFVPIKLFYDWTVWNEETNTVIRRCFKGDTHWNTGAPVLFEEVNWSNGQPPLANYSVNIICMPATEMRKENPEDRHYAVLALQYRNEVIQKTAKKLLDLMKQTFVEQQVISMSQLVMSLDIIVARNKEGKEWFEFSNPKFIRKASDETYQLLKPIYQEFKDIDKAGNKTQVLLPSQEVPKQLVTAEVVEHTTVESQTVIVDKNSPF